VKYNQLLNTDRYAATIQYFTR